MRIASDVRRSSVRGGVALAVLLASVPIQLPAIAADGDDSDAYRSLEAPIPDGEWLGEMDAVGQYGGVIEGVDTDVMFRIYGSFIFDVAQGSASGDWSWSGFMVVDVDTPQADSILVADLQANGPVSGGDRTLQLQGRSTTAGSVVSSAGSQNFGPNVEAVDLPVQLTSVNCNVVVGDWITPLDAAIDTGGLAGSLDGTFVATYWGESIDVELANRIDDLYDEAKERLEEAFGDGQVDYGIVTDLVNRAVDLEYEARREQVCVFEDSNRYVYGPMARLILTYIQYTLLDSDVPADTLWPMVDTLLWVNAIGSGADPNISREVMPLIEEQAQRIFEENLVSEGTNADGVVCSTGAPCLRDSSDVDKVLLIGDRLNLTFDYVGTPVTASQILQQTSEAGR